MKKKKIVAIILRKEISTRNLTFVNRAVTVSPFPSTAVPRPFILGSVGTRICSRLAHECLLLEVTFRWQRKSFPMRGTSFPRTVSSLFVVKRDHYYSRYFSISAWNRHNFQQVSIFETADVEKCARSSLSLSRTNIDVIFVCSRVPKCKTEIVTVSISDPASAPFARSREYFFNLNWPVVRMHVQKMMIYDIKKLIFLL